LNRLSLVFWSNIGNKFSLAQLSKRLERASLSEHKQLNRSSSLISLIAALLKRTEQQLLKNLCLAHGVLVVKSYFRATVASRSMLARLKRDRPFERLSAQAGRVSGETAAIRVSLTADLTVGVDAGVRENSYNRG